MKRKILAVVIVSLLVTVGAADAATNRNITKFLRGVADDVFQIDGTLVVKKLKVTGTSKLNGKISNTKANQPVTIQDDAKITGNLTVEGIVRAATFQDLLGGIVTTSSVAMGASDESTWTGTTYGVNGNELRSSTSTVTFTPTTSTTGTWTSNPYNVFNAMSGLIEMEQGGTYSGTYTIMGNYLLAYDVRFPDGTAPTRGYTANFEIQGNRIIVTDTGGTSPAPYTVLERQ